MAFRSNVTCEARDGMRMDFRKWAEEELIEVVVSLVEDLFTVLFRIDSFINFFFEGDSSRSYALNFPKFFPNFDWNSSKSSSSS